MLDNSIEFELLDNQSPTPYNLLLLADETKQAIDKYVFDSKVYLGKQQRQIIGVFCLYKIDSSTVELKNIAIDTKFQGKGYGSVFMQFIKELLKGKYEKLIVGTPDIANRQINFYQKNGFVKSGVRKNFFIQNYDKPIVENGIQLKDMVILECCL
ncbi:GNAT family N-acetyltransferase [Myroides sp. LJL115]